MEHHVEGKASLYSSKATAAKLRRGNLSKRRTTFAPHRRSEPAWAAKVSRSAKVQSIQAHQAPQPPANRRGLTALASVLAVGCGAGYFLWLALWFTNVSASPGPRTNDQRIMVVLDRPEVPMQLVTTLTEGFNDQTDEISMRLDIPSTYEGPTVTAKVFFQGTGLERPDFSRVPEVESCSLALYVVPAEPLKCQTLDLTTFEAGLTDGPAQVLSIALTRKDPSATVYLDIDEAGWSYSAGKRTTFSLPQIGTADTHPSVAGVGDTYPEVGELFVPKPFASIISYREIRPNERLDSSSPTPALDDTLAWRTDYYGLVAPKGSLTDIDKEEKQTTDTAVIGFLAGLGVSLIAMTRSLLLLIGEFVTRQK